MSPRAIAWAVGLLVAFYAFLTALFAIGMGWHL